MVKIRISCIELRVVCTLAVAPDTCWVEVSALQRGLVLNHPLGSKQVNQDNINTILTIQVKDEHNMSL